MQPAKLALVVLGITVPAGAIAVVAKEPPVRGEEPGIERRDFVDADEQARVATELESPALRRIARPARRGAAPAAASPARAAAPQAAPPTEAELQALIDDLRDDDERWNATTAAGSLVRHAHGSPAGLVGVWNALQRCCTSTDRQQRDIAVGLLLRIGETSSSRGASALVPSDALLDRTIEWLDRPPRTESRIFVIASSRTQVLFAMQRVDLLEERLVDAVASPGDRDPFRHAFVLGATGRSKYVHLIAPILVPHLRSNHRSADACMATEALVRLGPAVLPHLDEALADADEQQRRSIEAIRLEVLAPSASRATAAQRGHLNVISDKYDAAARSWRFETSYKRFDRMHGF